MRTTLPRDRIAGNCVSQKVISQGWPTFFRIAEGKKYDRLKSADRMAVREQVVADFGGFYDSLRGIWKHAISIRTRSLASGLNTVRIRHES